MSLRTRLLVGLAVLVLAAVALSGWVLLVVAHARLKAAQLTQAELVGEQVFQLVGAGIDSSQPLASPVNEARLGPLVKQLTDRRYAREVVAVDRAGKPVVGDPAGDWQLNPARASSVFALRRGDDIYVYGPLRAGAATVGAVRVRLGGDDVLKSALESARYILVSVALLMTVVVMTFGAMFIRRLIGPLEALARSADRVAAGELDVPPVDAPEGGDELTRLTQAFNRMTASLRAQRDHLVAQEKLATVGRLSAGVAHEVGNPLAAVLGYVDLMLPDEKDPERRDMLQRVRKETDRIRAIIADLLDYSRPVAIEREPVDLRDAVETSVSLLRPQARFRGVEVNDTIDPDLPRAAASSSRLTQVLINLLLNAADAMQGAGAIHVDAAADDTHVTMLVRDTGPGIPAADRGRIFDPFFTTKEPGAGTGLGLAISLSIVEAMGGELTLLDGKPGATFRVKLPRWTNPPAEG